MTSTSMGMTCRQGPGFKFSISTKEAICEDLDQHDQGQNTSGKNTDQGEDAERMLSLVTHG